ncbi:hypothetical protein [Roseibium album]|uniref:hypothetical protein n=1 Tax=Roseibium album TaxID=311410 RepID=UPI0024935872|nr:hypothetical protein [Roseibium album]
MNEAQNHNHEIARWFSDVVNRSGLRQKDIADLLGLTETAITRIKNKQQKLSATQLLILHEELEAPLPQINKKPGTVEKTSESQPIYNKTTSLFDIAYDRVAELNDATPEDKKMSQHEMLETVFHAMRRISSNPK